MQGFLGEITGLENVSLATMAGAHGELAGMLMIRAYHQARGDTGRTKVAIPDSAHGTNPASAAMAGFDVVDIPSDKDGSIDLEALRAQAGPDLAGAMITLPSTLGLFNPNIIEVCQAVHHAGGLVYGDGANMNALLGRAKLGDLGFDVCPPEPAQDLQHSPRRRRPRRRARVRRTRPARLPARSRGCARR